MPTKMKGQLAGKTLFITGASRGIGQAIAERAARDGANIVIAAKTATPHPKLPGTIYTAAEAIEKLGGQCLPCVVDIRDEAAVQAAVDETVSKFGGIDILVNNASAINLSGTEGLDMKRYDLMHSINTRGTYLCSKLCIPHLKKSSNPHILNLSPPLLMDAKWFKNHVGYTMAKMGMSMCVLGMAEELKDAGIAVNALWPKTAIYTAAMEMLGGGGEIKKSCRTADICSDSAYAIITKNSRSFTGNFCVDEDILRKEGVTDFTKYACEPGHPLQPDFFLDVEPNDPTFQGDVSQIYNESLKQGVESVDGGQVAGMFELIKGQLNEKIVQTTGAVFQFELSGSESGTWHLDLKSGVGAAGTGASQGAADVVFKMDSKDFIKMFKGELKATSAFMTGKLKIKGDIGKAMKLEKLMGNVKSKM
ncbi:hydroxysteroid dehydrogenase-like protein 2 isoform X1 [Apostichopus japonicus]|uniref:hydroxysteroid dehydrogenase-like protein 2 isoform X1 n=1 Tax=Stichopus japonicus TaxID=307972 RepID=UPI003AB53521